MTRLARPDAPGGQTKPAQRIAREAAPEGAPGPGGVMDWSNAYTLIRSARRRTVSLVVKPDGSLHVTAPARLPEPVIGDFVRQKAAWITRKRQEIAISRPPSPPKRYVDAEPHLYLGHEYPLAVSKTGQRGATLKDGAILVCVPDPDDPACVEAALNRWYGARAKAVLTQRFEAWRAAAARISNTRPYLVIRALRRSWGNCRSDGRITLNRALIKAPEACIDYVIAHEVCHLKHMNHSPAFYALQGELVPDWRARRAALERVMA